MREKVRRNRVLGGMAGLGLLLSSSVAWGHSSTPTPTPMPSQESEPEPREGWYRPGTSSREARGSKAQGGGGWSDGYHHEEDPWDIADPNQDSLFFLPTGQTLRRG